MKATPTPVTCPAWPVFAAMRCTGSALQETGATAGRGELSGSGCAWRGA